MLWLNGWMDGCAVTLAFLERLVREAITIIVCKYGIAICHGHDDLATGRRQWCVAGVRSPARQPDGDIGQHERIAQSDPPHRVPASVRLVEYALLSVVQPLQCWSA